MLTDGYGCDCDQILETHNPESAIVLLSQTDM